MFYPVTDKVGMMGYTHVTPLSKSASTVDELNIADPLFLRPFSLAAAAKVAKTSKYQLRGAILRGELEAKQNAQQHYSIQGSDLFQYIANRDREMGKTPVKQSEVEPGNLPGIEPEIPEGNSAPSEPVIPLSVHESVVKLMERQLERRDLDVEKRERDVEEWRARVPKQLTHDKPRSRVGGWVAGSLIVVIGSLLVWYRVELLDWLRSIQR